MSSVVSQWPSKRMREQCEPTRERGSEWPSSLRVDLTVSQYFTQRVVLASIMVRACFFRIWLRRKILVIVRQKDRKCTSCSDFLGKMKRRSSYYHSFLPLFSPYWSFFLLSPFSPCRSFYCRFGFSVHPAFVNFSTIFHVKHHITGTTTQTKCVCSMSSYNLKSITIMSMDDNDARPCSLSNVQWFRILDKDVPLSRELRSEWANEQMSERTERASEAISKKQASEWAEQANERVEEWVAQC